MNHRLPERPGEWIRRDSPIDIRFEGRPIRAYEGDTVGSALAAANVLVTGRSFKYHRPRGQLCMVGACANCLMRVDGVPNVRACVEPVRPGMHVERQNAWPSADRDVSAVLDRLSFLMPAGFYYKVFQRPRWLWPFVEPFIRSRAGLGKVPDVEDHGPRERINLHPHVLIVGAGPAGLAAATAAAGSGARTVLLEQDPSAGGRLRDAAHDVEQDRMVAEAEAAGVTILAGTAAFGVFEGPLVAAASADALYRIRARSIVFATGSIEQLPVFPNNDLPGVILSSAAKLLIERFRVRPGTRAVVLTGSEEGHATAAKIADSGAEVTVVDLRLDASSGDLAVIPGSTILSATGRRRVRAVTVGPPGASAGRRLPCDVVVVADFTAPLTGLVAMTGARLSFDVAAQAHLPAELPTGVFVAGSVAGARTVDQAVAEGRIAGLQAAAAAGHPSRAVADELRTFKGGPADGDERVLPPELGTGSGKQFACLCMDVTDKELKVAVTEGFDSMELLKRYTTITMGPCQGRACMLASQRLCARATGGSLATTNPTTARPPSSPVELGTLAGDRLTPTKETTLHEAHAQAGAVFMWSGEWRRPHHYTSAELEAETVRTAVGAIDVGTLGKFRVKGPQAADLLERLYPSRFRDLDVGRVRYGVMLNDEGAILDDGAVCRLDEDEFFVTVTTGNTAALERWMTWWQADWRLDCHLLNVTGAFASVNVAGPRARDVLMHLTEADVSAESFPYMSCRQMDLAGVAAMVLRIGFVGELGYEIHFPSMYGRFVWDRILAAGDEFGIRPFGVDAQRILRLEKQHILVGQDTDAESDPYEVGLGWMVKADKSDFLGKRALEDLESRGPAERLVGFTTDPGWIPPEGSSVVDDGVWVGRVTSARRSAAAGATVGLAWVPSGWAVEGTGFEIQFGSTTAQARVALRPSYDAEGKRLRS